MCVAGVQHTPSPHHHHHLVHSTHLHSKHPQQDFIALVKADPEGKAQADYKKLVSDWNRVLQENSQLDATARQLGSTTYEDAGELAAVFSGQDRYISAVLTALTAGGNVDPAVLRYFQELGRLARLNGGTLCSNPTELQQVEQVCVRECVCVFGCLFVVFVFVSCLCGVCVVFFVFYVCFGGGGNVIVCSYVYKNPHAKLMLQCTMYLYIPPSLFIFPLPHSSQHPHPHHPQQHPQHHTHRVRTTSSPIC